MRCRGTMKTSKLCVRHDECCIFDVFVINVVLHRIGHKEQRSRRKNVIDPIITIISRIV